MPSCLVIQHVEPESSYWIGEALTAAGIEIVTRRIHCAEPLPRHIGDFDGLVVMGGPMSAKSDEGFPTRGRELALLVESLGLGLPTLGVCLGAQLLATAAGGHAMAGNAGPEIGWAPVQLSTNAAKDPLFSGVPDELTVLHWHGETYELPPGATHLASSVSYREQAFRVGESAWGLQFHLEVDQVAIEAFATAFADEARAAGTPVEAILAAAPRALEVLAPYRSKVVTRFASLMGTGRSLLEVGLIDELADRA
jgi:GMP synthase-like glutamine amidotransferase